MTILSELARVKALFQARTIAAFIGAKPPKPEAFAWRGDLEACRQHVLAKDAAKRSDRTRRGNHTRAAQRRAGA